MKRIIFMCALISIFFFAFSVFPAFGEQKWIGVSRTGDFFVSEKGKAEKPTVLMTDVSRKGLTVRVFVPGFRISKSTTKGGDFAKLDFPSYGVTNQIGKPRFPVIRILIKGPKDSKVQFQEKLLTPASAPQEMWQWGFPERVLPVQPPIPKIPGAMEAAPFTIDKDAYQEDLFRPQRLVNIEEIGIQRENKLFLLEVFSPEL